ncbi:MAG: hypothetical protein K5639_03260 [Eubacterium sp.]|nr:hypothetical protein [Eubacterium sp.]
MKKKLTCILLILVLLLSACVADAPAPQDNGSETGEKTEQLAEYDPSGTWAIYWYLCGSDLESEQGCATDDLLEMMKVKLPDNVKIIIQTGGASVWNNDMISEKKIGRYEYSGEDFVQVDELKQANMGKEETLTDFLGYCNQNYPADHKMFLFWDHGGGSPSGVAQDENYDGDMLTLPEMRKAFESACEASSTNPPFDIIGFDTCLMATIDVANIFKDMGRYLVASEETEPGTGWSYNKWLGKFADNTEITPDEIGKIICDTYIKQCEKDDFADEATLSVTDLSKIDPILDAYSKLGDEALVNAVNDESFQGKFDRAAKKTENYGGNTEKSGYSDMADLGDLAKHTEKILPNSSQAVVDAIGNAVVYQVKGEYKSKANGLSCFINYSSDPDLLEGYSKATGTPSFDYYYTYKLTNKFSDKAYDYVSKLLGNTNLENREKFKLSKLEDKKLKIEDGSAVLNIGAENAKHLSRVSYELYKFIDDGDIMLMFGDAGTENDVEADWDQGVFKENFRGVWGTIDGHLVYMEVSNFTDKYTLYQIPIKLNKKKVFLSVAYINSSDEYKILGARKEYSNGLPGKNSIKLKKGDKISTIMYGYSGELDDVIETTVDTFKVKNNTSFTEEELNDGKFIINFKITGTDGKSVTSDSEEFKMKNGEIRYL